MAQPSEIFKSKIDLFKSDQNKYNDQFNRLSVIRISLFLISVIALVYLANERNFFWVSLIVIVFPFVFGAIVKIHNRVRYKRNHAKILYDINEEEIFRSEGNLKIFDQGDQFIDPLHPYLSDLDVFGNNSLFQLLNRTNTSGGKSMLAAWFKSPADNDTIISRQKAVEALQDDLEWRQEFQARARHFKDEKTNIEALLEWLEDPSTLKPEWAYLSALIILPVLTLGAIFLWAFAGHSYLIPLAFLVINFLVLMKINSLASYTTENTYKGIEALKAYGVLIEMIENKEFEAERLAELKYNFKHHHFKASDEIKKLHLILDFLQVRSNVFYQLVNVILLLDVYWLFRSFKWKKRSGEFVKHWFLCIDEFEVINSLAGFHYSNPSYTTPKLSTNEHVFKAKDLGHPLIKKNIRIVNDMEMEGKGKILIITGSNMAGKSTFLRTVGINVVLGLMGAPVCASTLTLSNTQVFTSMRTEDNLEESVSSFYAELKRLKQLLTYLKQGIPVLFMLDEILKGTNSQDRHRGAVALVRQLSNLNASGFVSTHDIELGRIKEGLPNVENYSFNSEIIDDEIIFNYKITEGICKSFNASKLMAKMGIEIEDEELTGL
ncbi:MutS family DNA mismatch repair protein [soil metagenome]